ncbi:MAG: VCBS repeat-containing protein, partial [Planctomycetota bacterium]
MPVARIGLLAMAFAIGMARATGAQPPAFRVHLVNPDSQFSSATAFDVNQDGRLDIVCGAYWYAAPDWTPRRIRDIEQIRGRFDDYSNLALDVDRDGDLDIISVNYRSSSLYWSRNPGPTAAGRIWDKIVIDRPGHSETGRLVDIDGDGMLDVLPNGTDFAAWYEVVPDADAATGVRWLRHPLPEVLAGHGIGYGDLNGDGRLDIIGPRGWAEGPEDPRRQRWVFHADFRLARDCGIPILCRDVDGDGDQDLVWGRGHHLGLYWSERLPAGASSVSWETTAEELDPDLLEYVRRSIDTGPWRHHTIDARWSNAHTLMQADIDGDGTEDLVAGKRYQGHGGRDPGENDPLSVWWYGFDAQTRTWRDHCISSGGTCGIDVDSTCVDLDGDGDIDVLAPAISGLHWLENLGVGSAQIDRTPPPVDPLERILAHRDPYRLDVWFDPAGRPHGLENWLQHGVRRQQILRQ